MLRATAHQAALAKKWEACDTAYEKARKLDPEGLDDAARAESQKCALAWLRQLEAKPQ